MVCSPNVSVMMEIIMLALVCLLLAKAKPRRRRMTGTYIKGNIDINADLGTLAARTALVVPTADQVSESARLTSIDNIYGLADFSPTVDVGPVVFGVAHGDYTAVEIEEWMELQTGWDVADLVSREISSRLIRRIGTFEESDSSTISSTFNDGKPMKTRLNWALRSGQGLDFWVYNAGTAAFVTTVPRLVVNGHANIFTK